MKKFRLLKAWLKNAKYSFKQKNWRAAFDSVLRTRNLDKDKEVFSSDSLFKAMRIRLRRLEWRESDERFFRRGFRHAFTFHPKERGRAPWLESLMYTRSLYNFNRGEYRRDQFPREQKANKWLQRVRKLLYRNKFTNVYIKSRR